jgi:iron complex outermembrane receptor protein
MRPSAGKRFKTTLLASAAISALSMGHAASQSAGNVEDEMLITGVRASLARAIDQKKNADGVVDGIVAEDIADFPDLNISESLQRITGVTINRTLGEGQQVSVRGLAPEFTRVTINGQTVTSGNPGREVDFDIFASELFNNVQLAKTPSASMTEGGLAATIDLRTARPFDYKGDGPTFAVSGQLSRNDLREKTDPRITALASNTFGDGKFGILASVSYSESSLRQDNVEGLRFISTNFDLDNDGTDETLNVEIPFIPRYLLELLDRERIGVTGAVQFRPTENFDINLDVAYATFDETRVRHSIDGLLSASADPVGTPTIDSTGLVTRATYDNVSSRSENIYTPAEEDLLLANLDTAWRFGDNWELRTKFGYSKANKDSDEFRSVYQAIDTFTYDFSDRIFVSLEPENTDFTNPNHFSANQSRYFNTYVDDREYSMQVDLERSFDDSFIRSIEVGVRYNNGKKTQNRFDGRITFPTGTVPPTAAVAASLPVDDFFGGYDQPWIPRTWFVTDFDAVFADPILNPDDFEVPQAFIDSFEITEKTIAGYVQVNLDGNLGAMPVRGNFGVRVVETDQTSNGYLATGTPLSRKRDYSEVLPSFNLVGEASEDLLIRLAASKSLTRPTLTALAPGGTIAPTGLTARLGNPNLDPFTAWQLDASLEWYFSDEGLAAVTFFYKDVDGFITQVVSEGQVDAGTLINDLGEDVSNAIFTITQPINGDKATVKGFELSLQMPFTFLPAPFDGFGALANYTYTKSKSEITFQGQTIQTLLPGQSKTSYNLIGYYEKGAFSTRLAYSWRDKYLYEVRAGNERSNFLKSYGQLDFNIQYAITDNFVVTFDALNILAEETYRYAQTQDRNIAFSETGRFFIIGARFKY